MSDVYQLAQTLIGPAEETVRSVGTFLESYRGPLPKDTGFERGHEANEIDVTARNQFLSELTMRFPNYDGVIWTEDQPVEQKFLPTNGDNHERRKLWFVIDECEGTTNMKRWLHSPLESDYRPNTGVSMGISLSENLADLAVGAFYDMRSRRVLSAMRAWSPGSEPEFLSFNGRTRLEKTDFADKRGDSAYRVIVAGYSNNCRIEMGKLEQVLQDAKFRVYDGSRASGPDLISILANQSDAYIDLRALLSRKVGGKEMNAQLQVYDVCGTLPIVIGCGLKATDPFGEPYHKYNFRGKIPLVVARPTIHQRILDLVQPYAEAWKKELAE